MNLGEGRLTPISNSGRWAEKEIGEKIESPEFRGYILLKFIILAWLTNSDSAWRFLLLLLFVHKDQALLKFFESLM